MSIQIGRSSTDFYNIERAVREGTIKQFFSIGDTIHTTWISEDYIEYDCPLVVVDFGKSELKNHKLVPNMTLQWKYATPNPWQYDNSEALYYTAEDLEPGIYYFQNNGNKNFGMLSYECFVFVLRRPLPKGYVIELNSFNKDDRTLFPMYYKKNSLLLTMRKADSSVLYDTAVLHRRDSYIEKGESKGAKFLGYIEDDKNSDFDKDYDKSGVNQKERIFVGYNKYSESAIHQYLNADNSQWWKAQHKFDISPCNNHKRGFMGGYIREHDFIDVILDQKITTKYNNEVDETYAKWFLPSIDEEHWGFYCDDSKAWEYYMKQDNENTCKNNYYRIDNHNVECKCWLRSAYAFGNIGITKHRGFSNYLSKESLYLRPVCAIG